MLNLNYSLAQTEALCLEVESHLAAIETLYPHCPIHLDRWDRCEDDGYHDARAGQCVRSINAEYLKGYVQGSRERFLENRRSKLNQCVLADVVEFRERGQAA